MTTYVRQLSRSASFSGVGLGLREGAPVSLSVIPWGLAYGLLAQQFLPLSQAMTMSGYVYSGTAQFVVLEMWRQPLAIGAMLIAVAAVNARYLLQGATLAPWLADLSFSRRLATLCFLSDASWAMSLKRFEQGDGDSGYLFGTSLAIYAAWVASSLAGYLIPMSSVNAEAWGLDFAIAAALIALTGARWTGRQDLLPWAVAGIVSLAAYEVFGGYWYMLVGAIAGAVAGAWRE